MSVFRVSVLITLAGKRAKMTNGETFFYVALGIIFAVGAYTFYLAVMLDRALKLIEKQKQEIARLVLPPF